MGVNIDDFRTRRSARAVACGNTGCVGKSWRSFRQREGAAEAQ
jgi:hypothetical protein